MALKSQSLVVSSLRHAALVGVLGAAASADAAITSVSGAVSFLATPPASALPGVLVGPPAYCWDEQTNVSFGWQMVNLTLNPGVYTGPASNFGVVSGTFDSHFIRFDASSGVANVTGVVNFSANIAAVIYDGLLLDATDLSLGNPGTVYSTGNPGRSYMIGVLHNSTIQLLGNSLHFDLWAFAPANFSCELRVLTYAVPSPGSLALLGVGGLVCSRRRRA